MNRFGKFFILASLSVSLLAGCSNERDDLISEAKALFQSGNYPDALTSLNNAKALEDFNKDEIELSDMHLEAMQYVYEGYVGVGKDEFNKKNYQIAIEMFTEANKIVPQDTYTLEQIELSKDLLEKQKQFDKYGDLVINVMKDSNAILQEFSRNLDSYKVGVITEKEFIVSVKVLIPKSNDIVTSIDAAFYSIDESLTPVHQELIELVDFQHRTLLSAIDNDENMDAVEKLRSKYLIIKKDQTTLIETLKNYATEHNLLFDLTKDNSSNENKTPASND